MEFNKQTTACFSGYRPYKFDFPLTGNEYDAFTTRLLNEVVHAIEVGYSTFLVGMAPGFDIISGEIVIFARRNFAEKNIRLIAALPYEKFSSSKHFDTHWQERYQAVLRQVDAVINISGEESWTKNCYDRRNKFMADNSSLLLCYSTDKSGGTADTIAYCKNNGIKIVNVAHEI